MAVSRKARCVPVPILPGLGGKLEPRLSQALELLCTHLTEEADELERLVTAKTESVQYDHPNHTVTVTTVSDLDLSGARLLGLPLPEVGPRIALGKKGFGSRWVCGGCSELVHIKSLVLEVCSCSFLTRLSSSVEGCHGRLDWVWMRVTMRMQG